VFDKKKIIETVSYHIKVLYKVNKIERKAKQIGIRVIKKLNSMEEQRI
jgi:hypothetical protein